LWPLLHLDRLLPIRSQSARRIGLGAQSLNGIRHRRLVRHHGLPDRGIVVDVVRHHLQHIGEVHQRNEGRVEALLLRRIRQLRALQVGIVRQPVVDIQDLLRVRRRRRDLRQQRVRVQRHWRQQLIQLLRIRCRNLRVKFHGNLHRNQAGNQNDSQQTAESREHELPPQPTRKQ